MDAMSRASLQTTKCMGCHRIAVSGLWIRERREYHVRYRVSLCPQCVVLENQRFSKTEPADFPQPRWPSGRATRI